ncbi:MAG: MarR family transcriptional regulator [Litorilinea sp.]
MAAASQPQKEPAAPPLRELGEAEIRLASLLLTLAGHGQRWSSSVLTDFDLTPNELAVLAVVGDHSSLMMVKDIHAALPELSPSTLTRVLDTLERKDLLLRSLNTADRRSFQVALSVGGQDTLRAYRAALTQRFAAAGRSLSSGERMLLSELLDRILAT